MNKELNINIIFFITNDKNFLSDLVNLLLYADIKARFHAILGNNANLRIFLCDSPYEKLFKNIETMNKIKANSIELLAKLNINQIVNTNNPQELIEDSGYISTWLDSFISLDFDQNRVDELSAYGQCNHCKFTKSSISYCPHCRSYFLSSIPDNLICIKDGKNLLEQDIKDIAFNNFKVQNMYGLIKTLEISVYSSLNDFFKNITDAAYLSDKRSNNKTDNIFFLPVKSNEVINNYIKQLKVPNTNINFCENTITIDESSLSDIDNVQDILLSFLSNGTCFDSDLLRFGLFSFYSNKQKRKFDFERLEQIINTNLVNKYINLAYRVSCLFEKIKKQNNKINPILINIESIKRIENCLFDNEFYFLELLDQQVSKINQKLNEKKPWKHIDENIDNAIKILIEILKDIISLNRYWYPVIPKIANKISNTFTSKSTLESGDSFIFNILSFTPLPKLASKVDFFSAKLSNDENPSIYYKNDIPGIAIWKPSGMNRFYGLYKGFEEALKIYNIPYNYYFNSNFIEKNDFHQTFGVLHGGKQLTSGEQLLWASESNLQTYPYLLENKIFNEAYLSLVQRFRSESIRSDDMWRNRNLYPCLGLNMISSKSEYNLDSFKKIYDHFFDTVKINVKFLKMDKNDYGEGFFMCAPTIEGSYTGLAMIYLLGTMFNKNSDLNFLNSGITGKLLFHQDKYGTDRECIIVNDLKFKENALVYIHKNCAKSIHMNVIGESIYDSKKECLKCGIPTHPCLISRSASFY